MTPAFAKEVVARALLASHWTVEDVAAELRMSRTTLGLIRQDCDLPAKLPAPAPAPNPRRAEAVALARSLKNATQAADQLGIPRTTLHYWCRCDVSAEERATFSRGAAEHRKAGKRNAERRREAWRDRQQAQKAARVSRALRLVHQGLSDAAIRAHMGVALVTLWGWRKAGLLPPRGPGKRLLMIRARAGALAAQGRLMVR